MSANARSPECCIAGGGPAGLMLGYLLARNGIVTTVLEKHDDFLRDFRGDTLHPSTLEVMHELGLLDRLLQLPHQKVPNLSFHFNDQELRVVDFSHLPTVCKFVALMPQWDFLNFLSKQASTFPGFNLLMGAEAKDLVVENGIVTGVAVETNKQTFDVAASKLVIAADGRSSVLRERSALEVEDLGAPIDVLWFRLQRDPADTDETMGRLDQGRIMILLNRGNYWQCAYVIAKGGRTALEGEGLEAFRKRVANVIPFDPARADALTSWDDIKTLTVKVDRLKKWHRDGLLVIGDAAHAMSPVGGVGINLAIQDAVASANVLVPALRASNGRPAPTALAAIQERRMFPTRMTQAMQVNAHKRIWQPALRGEFATKAPWPLRLIDRYKWLARLPARIIGMGFRPEHVSELVRKGANSS
jgi:2-polyprenyl-6-methoxyphenol hydroxylase-like FAD-dependent oxidoreductase